MLRGGLSKSGKLVFGNVFCENCQKEGGESSEEGGGREELSRSKFDGVRDRRSEADRAGKRVPSPPACAPPGTFSLGTVRRCCFCGILEQKDL